VGQKKYKGLEMDERTGGTRGDQLVRKMIRLREDQRTMLGERAAERKKSFWKVNVTAKAVTHKTKAESKNAVDVFSRGRYAKPPAGWAQAKAYATERRPKFRLC
jgi:hypothetical protein